MKAKSIPVLTARLNQHQEKWETCKACPLGSRARQHAVFEIVPAGRIRRVSIVFLGEGPGEHEDIEGRPFVGRAGTFLRETIEEVNPDGIPYGLFNLVVCRPQNRREGTNRQPQEKEILACSDRLIEFLKIIGPKIVVCLGRVPSKWLPYLMKSRQLHWGGEMILTYHPSYIVRTGGSGSHWFERWKKTLEEAIREAVK